LIEREILNPEETARAAASFDRSKVVVLPNVVFDALLDVLEAAAKIPALAGPVDYARTIVTLWRGDALPLNLDKENP
jgi:hypothetical protein